MGANVAKFQLALTSTIVEARELYRFYHIGDDETLALRGVSMEVNAGEMVAVVGPSGSGKSTLVNCIAGLDEPDGGFVFINGQRISRRNEQTRADLRSKFIGILLQSGNLFDHLTVEQNVKLKMGFADQHDASRVTEVLTLVGVSERRHAYPSQLSGGEAARAGLAVAIAPRPPLLIADEPTGEVDAATEQRVMSLLDDHRKSGGASLIVTHSDVVAGRADRVVRLEDGKVVQ